MAPVELTERYKQVCEDGRFYADMRFKQLTLFSVVTGLLLNAATSDRAQQMLSRHDNKTTLGIAGMFFTVILWIMETRSTIYGLKIRAEKETLEEVNLSPLYVLSSTYAIIVLYFASYYFWFRLWIDARPLTSCGRLGGLLLAFVGIFFLAYSVRKYVVTWRSISREDRVK
jgi:hypothetical protein